jgi:hypothetical protein
VNNLWCEESVRHLDKAGTRSDCVLQGNVTSSASLLFCSYVPVGLREQKPFITRLLFFSFFVYYPSLPVRIQCFHFPYWPGTGNLNIPGAKEVCFSNYSTVSLSLSPRILVVLISAFCVCLLMRGACNREDLQSPSWHEVVSIK